MSMTYYGPRGRSQGTILKIQENTMVPRLRPLGPFVGSREKCVDSRVKMSEKCAASALKYSEKCVVL